MTKQRTDPEAPKHKGISYLLVDMHTPGITKVFHDLLDGVNYTITHDLRRVFESELVGPIAEQSIPVVYGKIVHAHGLLTNSLQQMMGMVVLFVGAASVFENDLSLGALIAFNMLSGRVTGPLVQIVSLMEMPW